MADRIYLVTQNGTQRLIRAASQHAARSHAAKSTISVSVATVEESIVLTQAGVLVESGFAHPEQLSLLQPELPAEGEQA